MSDRFVDVAVIGRGLMGSAAARHLAEAGRDVGLIGPDEPADRASHAGVFGSHYDSGRIARILDPQLLWARLAKRAIRRFRNQEAASGIRFFSEVGTLFIAPDDPGRNGYLPALERTAAALNTSFDRLSFDGLREMFPALGSENGCRALLERQHAGYLDPRAHLRSNEAILTRRGAFIAAQRVTKVEARPGMLVVSGPTLELRARQAIIATGAYTSGLRLPVRTPSLAADTWAMLLARLDTRQVAAFQKLPAVIYKPRDPAQHAYLLPAVRYPDGHWYLKIGSPFAVARVTNLDDLSRWFREPMPSAVEHRARALLRQIVPAFDFSDLDGEPCCTTHTTTGFPFIDFADDPRIVWLVGCNAYDSLDAKVFKARYP
jgi:glycine/D-amino acid oxidase-like deaminating enzyme